MVGWAGGGVVPDGPRVDNHKAPFVPVGGGGGRGRGGDQTISFVFPNPLGLIINPKIIHKFISQTGGGGGDSRDTL